MFLADGYVDAGDVAAALVDDRIDDEGGLAGLPVADDQLALPAADRDHRIDGLDAGLQRLGHGLAQHDARRLHFDPAGVVRVDLPLAIDRLAEGVDHAAEHPVADRDFGDAAGPAHLVALFDGLHFAEHRGADVVFFQIEGETVQVVGKLEQLAGGDAVQPVDAGDPVARGQHGSRLALFDLPVVSLYLLLDDFADLGGA